MTNVEPTPPLILEFLTRDPEVAGQFPITPTTRSMPDWWTEMPDTCDGQEPGPTNATLKRCPGINAWSGMTYTVPLWTDIELTQVGGMVEWRSPYHEKMPPVIDYMRSPQTQGHLTNGLDVALKFQTPWRVKCPEGWSFATLPVSYDPDPRWSVIPGIVHGDSFHVLNCIAAWNGGDARLEAGTPLMELLPIRRQKLQAHTTVVDEVGWVSGDPGPRRRMAPPEPANIRERGRRAPRARDRGQPRR